MDTALIKKQDTSWEDELEQIYEILLRCMPPYKEMNYFLDLARSCGSFDAAADKDGRVIILGTGIPEELIYGAGAVPYWILGGSRTLSALAGALSRYTGKRITRRGLLRAQERLWEARKQTRQFIKMTDKKPELFSGIWRMFLLHSYYFTGDLEEWTCHLDMLNRRLTADSARSDDLKSIQISARKKPIQAAAFFRFSFGADRELLYGHEREIALEDIRLYGKTEEQVLPMETADLQPIREDFIGYLVAALPEQEMDTNGDGMIETVYDFARADFGPHTYELAPREFDMAELPFELTFAERKYIQVFYQREPLKNAAITVDAPDGTRQTYETDGRGWIDGLPSAVLRGGFTASYSPDSETTYRMYYAIEDYAYFTEHFFKAYVPLLLILLLGGIGIVIVYFIREACEKKHPAHGIYSRERPGLRRKNPLLRASDSKVLLIRRLFLIFGFILWSFAGKLMSQGQTLNQIAVPVFSCPFNLDQTFESSCYYLTHLPVLFTRNWGYIVSFLVTLLLFVVLGGRILCGFMCPLGFVQDLFDQLRRALHIRPITVSDKMNQVIQPFKWLWTLLFLCFVFVGGDFCHICPNKIFSPALGGWWVNLALGGFLTIPLIVGSFYIKRFWCLMCPMGFLLGICYKFNLFKLKKDCTACTECGACYESCPMRLKNIYTEREKEEVQTIDCLMCGECIHKCPEDNALSMTFFGRIIYRSSRAAFMSRYAPKRHKKHRESKEEES